MFPRPPGSHMVHMPDQRPSPPWGTLEGVQVRVGCEFVHALVVPTHAVLQVEPRPDGAFASLDERWDNRPAVASSRYLDGYGNLCRRLTIPAGESTLRYDCLVEVAAE